MTWASVGFVTTLLHGVGSFIILFVVAGGIFFVSDIFSRLCVCVCVCVCVCDVTQFRTSVLDTDWTHLFPVFANYFFILFLYLRFLLFILYRVSVPASQE
jgi:hypothetical protein